MIFESVVHWLAASSSVPPSCGVSPKSRAFAFALHLHLLLSVVIKDYSQSNLTLLAKVCEDLKC